MNRKNKILFLTGILIVFQATAFAQQFSQEWLLKYCSDSADYVFEGTVRDSRSFRYVDNGNIYTANKVEVHHVLKGNIVSDTLNVITQGGQIGNTLEQLTHGIRLATGNQCIFFSKPDPNNGFPDSLKIGKNEPLVPIAFPMLIMKDSVFTGFGLTFNTRKLFFDTLRTFGLDVPEKAYITKRINYAALRKIQQPVDSVALKREEEERKQRWEKILEHEALILQKIEDEKKKTEARANVRIARVSDVTYYSIKDPVMTGGGFTDPRYLEFDVYIRSTNTAFPYLDLARFTIDFNSLGFGTNIASSTIVTKGSEFNTSTYTLEVQNNETSSSQLDIIMFVNDWSAPLPVYNRVIVTTEKKLLHVKIEIPFTGCGQNSDLNLVQTPNVAGRYVNKNDYNLLVDPGEGIDLAGSFDGDVLNRVLCYPVIDDISYSYPLAAGKDQLITITGYNFGDSRIGTLASGQVLFKNANSSEGIYVASLDNIDYPVNGWSDNKIQVKVPSNIGIALGALAGTGTIRVQTKWQEEAVSTEEVFINYAIINSIVGNPAERKYRFHLTQRNNESDIGFILHENVVENPEAVAAIEKAMQAWNCQLPFKLYLVKSSSDQYVTTNKTSFPEPENKFKNVIFFDKNNHGLPNPAMATSNTYSYCHDNQGKVTMYKSRSIISMAVDFKRTSNGVTVYDQWFYPTDETLPSFRADFYEAMLHELGHVIGLDHTLNKGELMYPVISYGSRAVEPYSRVTVDYKNYNVLMGTEDIVATSSAIQWANCADIGTYTDTKGKFCGIITSLSSILDSDQGINIYPIPVQKDGFTVSYSLLKSSEISYALLDYTGRVINVVESSLKSQGNRTDWISSEGISNGFFILLMTINGETQSIKIVKN